MPLLPNLRHLFSRSQLDVDVLAASLRQSGGAIFSSSLRALDLSYSNAGPDVINDPTHARHVLESVVAQAGQLEVLCMSDRLDEECLGLVSRLERLTYL